MEADDSIYNVNVFSTDDLWRQPTSFEDADTRESFLFAPLELDISSIKFDHPYAPKHTLERELRLPDLDTFEFGPLPDLESLDGSTISIDTLPLEPEEDVWETARKQGPANKHVLFYTWQSFEKGEHLDSPTPFLTERGPEVFDATLVRHEESDNDKPRAGRILKGHVLLQSLWNLGLARSSILFRFNPKLKTFESAVPDGRASGLTLLAAQSLTMYFIHIGSTFLYLRSFAERTFSSATAIAAKVALATSVSSVLSSLEDTLGKQSAEIRSLLQLQHQFARPREILMHVARMVDAAKHAKTNEQLSSILHHRLLELEEGDEHLRQLSCQVLCQVARPSLELLGEWMGIRKEDESAPIWQRNSFVAVEDPTVDPPSFEYSYKSEMMPRFISPEDGNTIFETGNSLRFLKTQHPQHPLARLDGLAVQPPDMEWGFAWQDIETLSSKAKAYEERLRRALLAYSARTTDVADALPMPSVPEPVSELPVETQHLDRYFEDSIESMNAPPKWAAQTLPDELQLLVGSILNTTEEKNAPFNTFSPPMSLASTLSFRPLITAQAKLVNAATVRLFFRSHQLRLHLSLQRQYHLLGDGVFSSLLATALFDPNRESAERHKGRMRSGVQMGLQLGSRKSWPPASSELRLALRGVLSESYYSSALYQTTLTAGVAKPPSTPLLNSRDNDELPGQLNFAIRNLTEAEQEKVMDPDALHALDFLRLQYVAPTPLNLVITTSALDKYDHIFKFLLRLLRMLFVVAHLPRSYTDTASRQFRAEAYHFVITLTNYVFQTGIAEPWADFDAFVATVERRLNEEDEARELGVRVTQGVSSLRDAHEACLDSILFALLLRKRQRKIMGLVEEVFEHILLFAKMQNAGAQEERFGDETVKGLYAKLRGKVRVFLSVCRGLTGKQGYGVGRGTREENQMERLVVGMEMNGYFAAS